MVTRFFTLRREDYVKISTAGHYPRSHPYLIGGKNLVPCTWGKKTWSPVHGVKKPAPLYMGSKNLVPSKYPPDEYSTINNQLTVTFS